MIFSYIHSVSYFIRTLNLVVQKIKRCIIQGKVKPQINKEKWTHSAWQTESSMSIRCRSISNEVRLLKKIYIICLKQQWIFFVHMYLVNILQTLCILYIPWLFYHSFRSSHQSCNTDIKRIFGINTFYNIWHYTLKI